MPGGCGDELRTTLPSPKAVCAGQRHLLRRCGDAELFQPVLTARTGGPDQMCQPGPSADGHHSDASLHTGIAEILALRRFQTPSESNATSKPTPRTFGNTLT